MRTYPNLERISKSQVSTSRDHLTCHTYTCTKRDNMKLVQLSTKYDDHAINHVKKDTFVEIHFSCYFDKVSEQSIKDKYKSIIKIQDNTPIIRNI